MTGRKVSHQRPLSRPAGARLPATPSKPSPLTASHGHAPEVSPDPTGSMPRSPGRPLEPPVRAFMEQRFGHDFRQVRIHADPAAARTANHLNANAYTVGPHIAFAGGAYAPGTVAGRRLLAHELTHVVQQRMAATVAPPESAVGESAVGESAEREARSASVRVASGGVVRISRGAPGGTPQFERRRVGGREFEIGDIKLSGRASVDVRRHGVLLPGADQAHILVTGDRRLGYEVAHTSPDDPFRWNRLRELVDHAKIDIVAVGLTDSIRVMEWRRGQAPRIVSRSLAALRASGITLPALSRVRAIDPSSNFLIASPDPDRDTVYYESGRRGRGIIGGNALAHELFGHLWLAHRGVPWRHRRQLTARHTLLDPFRKGVVGGITDPFGRPFTGSVDDYLDRFAGASHTALESPTQGVSLRLLAAALRDFRTAAHARGGLVRRPDGSWSASNAVGLQWERLSNNYEALAAPGPRPAGQEADRLVAQVVAIVRGLGADQRYVVDRMLSSILTGQAGSRRTRLAREVRDALARGNQ